MGMFDYVKYEMNCPKCGQKVTDFQTKDTACNMEQVFYWETDYFYASCDNCDTWIYFSRKEKKPFVPIEYYEMTYRNS